VVDQLKVSVCLTGYSTDESPRVYCKHNQHYVGDFTVTGSQQWLDFSVNQLDANRLSLDFYNKRDYHTKTDSQGKIVADMWIEIHDVRFDDILLESWFVDDGYYVPRYFASYKRQHIELPERIYSLRRWHFPGEFIFAEFPKDLWDWYRIERTSRMHLENMDIDLHRWEKFVGSPELYPELVAEIKELINGT
jgi:hypothetical protein